jgi:hypothetical protein
MKDKRFDSTPKQSTTVKAHTRNTRFGPVAVREHFRKLHPKWNVEKYAEVALDEYGYFYYSRLELTDEKGNHVWVKYADYPTYLEIVDIEAEAPGEGMGTKVLLTFKDYADSRDAGILITHVHNQEYFNKFDWLEQQEMTPPDPTRKNYVYGDVSEEKRMLAELESKPDLFIPECDIDKHQYVRKHKGWTGP